MSSAVEKCEVAEELTPDGYESLFDGRETERVANLIIGAPGPDTLSRSAAIFMKAAAHRQVYFQSWGRAGPGLMFELTCYQANNSGLDPIPVIIMPIGPLPEKWSNATRASEAFDNWIPDMGIFVKLFQIFASSVARPC